MREELVVIRGAGDLATGIAHRLWRSGFPVVMLEVAQPTVVRRTVALAEAVYAGEATVEGMHGRLVADVAEALAVLKDRKVPVLVDPEARSVAGLRPVVLVDAIIAKRNPGTRRGMAPVVIGVGPGFTAGEDVDAVVETQRGHHLGMVILDGAAAPDTGVPGEVMGYTEERVLRIPADAAGPWEPLIAIGDLVAAGQTVAYAGGREVQSRIAGVVRGLLRGGLEVRPGMKVGDVDPRADKSLCFTISDKARAVGGGVLEAICHFLWGRESGRM
ncbi:MAG: EF2563 family selenium-dependent molybdenum hydroxylase system protein [Clostridia bacterium]|nr:MAG: EF2563 family selenium-dependent molybdenum hydroxylase system protein [Clostridia bacterium]